MNSASQFSTSAAGYITGIGLPLLAAFVGYWFKESRKRTAEVLAEVKKNRKYTTKRAERNAKGITALREAVSELASIQKNSIKTSGRIVEDLEEMEDAINELKQEQVRMTERMRGYDEFKRQIQHQPDRSDSNG